MSHEVRVSALKTTMTAETIRRRIRIAASLATVLVATASAALSFSGLYRLGVEAGWGPLSALLPISIDGLILVGGLSVLDATLDGRRGVFGWAILTLGSAGSVAGNIAAAHGTVDRIVHAAPAVALVLTVEALMTTLRRRTADQAEVEAQERAAAAAEAAKRARETAAAERAAAPAKPKKANTSASTKRRAVDDAVLGRIAELTDDGLSQRAIAELLELSPSAIHRAQHKLREEAA